jgi:membrane protein YqaA with SNARE-associated domain
MSAAEIYITPAIGNSDEYQNLTAIPAILVAAVASGVGAYVGYRVAKALFH